MNGCIHPCTTRWTFFYSRIFRKRRGAEMIFAVPLYLPIIFTNVPGRGDKSTSLNRGCILQFISSQGSQRTAQKAAKPFPDLKLVIAHIASLLPSQLNASPARTLLCRSSPLQWRCNYSAVIAHLLPSAFTFRQGWNSENLGESSSAASQPHLSMSRRTEMVHAIRRARA